MENNDKVLNDRPLEDVSRENKSSFDVFNVSEGIASNNISIKEHVLEGQAKLLVLNKTILCELPAVQ